MDNPNRIPDTWVMDGYTDNPRHRHFGVLPVEVEWIDDDGNSTGEYSLVFEEIIGLRNTGKRSMVVVRRSDGLVGGTIVENWRILWLN